MSFITKRERVFNDYDLLDLPARNEGKLKAYASCTDARAWSHFCSDKSEHLVEVIKRNNETVRPKYLPTKVIVDTLMAAKNTEITRLKQKIEEFEQLLSAYDQLDLSCEQKCEIANAHATIKAANRELDDMYLDLDLSGFTEALDSEGFETGKSRGDGDEATPKTYEIEEPVKTESKYVQMESACTCEVSTLVMDPRIDEMQDIIISKDAKLNAMKNTIAVMENDVCEPYCIYANIYTALEKIFGILRQNDKYRQYLNLMTAGKDTRCIDIKGKILFKLKVLERFCIALIAPCNQEFANAPSIYECACYHADVNPCCIEANFAMTSSEARQPNIDNKRAHLVADIIQNDEMKEILSKESFSVRTEVDYLDDGFLSQNYNIDNENLARLKKLQENYDDLMSCYESLKHEKDCLDMRCRQYEELEKEFEKLKIQVKEYNSLWNEKEHYRKRSADLDALKQQYLILTDETACLETQLKAESEINHIKCKAIDDLRNENVLLEKKLNDALIAFEKEKNSLLCKLKEADCKIMCQGQQIKSLSLQIDRFLEQDQKTIHSHDTENNSIALMDEVESHKDQIKNLQNALFCNEEENQNLQQQYQDQLKLINELRMEVEDWKSAYEKTLQRNDYLEKYSESLIQETKILSQDAKEKSLAVENLMNVVKNKSQEINKLLCETEKRKEENRKLFKQINELQNNFDSSVASLESDKIQALQYLQLAREESQELLNKVKDYDEVIHSNADITKSLEMQMETQKELQSLLMNAVKENNGLKIDLANSENSNAILLKEINDLECENIQIKSSIELKQKESNQLQTKLKHFDNLTKQLQSLQDSHEKLIEEKKQLENKLLEKNYELDNAILSIQLTKRESDELIDKLQQSESIKDELLRLRETCQKLANEKHSVQKELIEKQNHIEDLLKTLNKIQIQNNEHSLQKSEEIELLEQELADLRKTYELLLNEKKMLEDDFHNKKQEFNKLYNILEEKIEENRELSEQLKSLEINAKDSIKALQDDNLTTRATLNVIKKESAELFDKIKHYETLEIEFDHLKRAHSQIKLEKEKLQVELDRQLADLKKIEKENYELHRHSQNLMTHNEDLENALINSRTELVRKSTSQDHSYKDIICEIKDLRQEKLGNQKKIRDLLDQLEESENVIANLSEDVLTRDHKIAILENHINELEVEVNQLHKNLAEVVDTGEQLKDFSFQKIDSLKILDAHHSKATHNMKMELAKLQHQKAQLEDQLSVTKIKSEESARESNVLYESQIGHLKNEQQIIATEIKQLELNSVGDSILGPNNCRVEDILFSLERIRKYLDTKNSKSTSLEQTLLKVQTSSQLLLSKADEAKRLVEKEKQKIINEKEDAIKDRQNMERQLLELKEKLEKQIADDKTVIENLEAIVLNQELIINKINNSTQEYISKLKEELQTLQELYHNSTEKIGKLQEQLENVTEDRSNQINMLNKLKDDFAGKCEEINALQKELTDLKNKTIKSVDTQTKPKTIYNDMGTQVDKELLYIDKVEIQYDDTNTFMNEKKGKSVLGIDNVDIFKPSTQPKQSSEPQIKQEELPINEVQILTANIEPTFDYVKNSYLNYKIRCLSHGRLEQHSFSCLSDNEINENRLTSQSAETEQESKESVLDDRSQNPNLIDIYNRQSMHTNSSKGNYESDNIINVKSSQRQSSAYVEFGTTDTNVNSKYIENKNVTESTSQKLTEKDLFVIYKDSQGSYDNREQEKGTWSEVVVEAVTVYSKKTKKHGNKKNIDQDSVFYNEEEEVYEEKEDKVKPKLKINIPRIENESNSLITTSDGDKKSIDSYTMAIYSTSKRLSASDTKINDNENGNLNKSSSPSLPTVSNEESFSLDRESKEYTVHRKILHVDNVETESDTSKQKHKITKKVTKLLPTNFVNESHHKLSRVEANVLLLKNDKGAVSQKATNKQKLRDFGLEYILDTVQGEVNPKKANDERFTKNAINENESEPNKTISSDKSKTFNEQSIMAKLDTNIDYENTINSLTKALENIEKDYKKKIEAIKVQYDTNIKSIINEHNQGVKSIQGLHEDTLQDIIKIHENEVENLRSMSIEAMRKAEKLEKENRVLKSKVHDRGTTYLDEEPMKMPSPELKKRKKIRGPTKTLTKTTVEAFNVKPKARAHGPCTCSLDINVSETIRNIFEEVDVEQRKIAEHTYIKYIANKMLSGNIEALDAQELSYLHLKVCRSWKSKLSKEEALQKRIDSLEMELLNKQRNAQQHFAELDRKVAEERRRLQEVREAVCRSTPRSPRASSPTIGTAFVPRPPPPTATTQKESRATYVCNTEACEAGLCARRSAGDLILSSPNLRTRRITPNDSGMGAHPRQDVEDRRDRRLYNDEPPTRLRRSHDRQLRKK